MSVEAEGTEGDGCEYTGARHDVAVAVVEVQCTDGGDGRAFD